MMSIENSFGVFDVLVKDHLGLRLGLETELVHRLCRLPLFHLFVSCR